MTAGRPPIFETPEEMQAVIDEYFDYCDNRIQQVYSPKEGGVIQCINPAPYTMSGLARRLGMDRRTLIDYAKRDKFILTIKAARQKVHEDVEQRLMEKNATGAIFNLKNNFGWKDSTEQELTHKAPEGIEITFIKPKKSEKNNDETGDDQEQKE